MAKKRTRPPRNRQMVSARTLADEWSVCVSTVHRLLERAGVPVYYLGDGPTSAKRWRREDVDAYLESCCWRPPAR